MKRKSNLPIYSIIIILGLSSIAYAQDRHYWNLQYGTRSTLLGGAVESGHSV